MDPFISRIFQAAAKINQPLGKIIIEALDSHGRDISYLYIISNGELAGLVEEYIRKKVQQDECAPGLKILKG
jgi:hypothetical protein